MKEDKVKIIYGTESQLIQMMPGLNVFLSGRFLGTRYSKPK